MGQLATIDRQTSQDIDPVKAIVDGYKKARETMAQRGRKYRLDKERLERLNREDPILFGVSQEQYGVVVKRMLRRSDISAYRTVRVHRDSIEGIIEEIAEKNDLGVTQLKGQGRHRPLVKARHEACYEIALRSEASLPMIGRHLGNRDHTTIIHSINAHCIRHNLPHPRTGEKAVVKTRENGGRRNG